MCASGRVLHLSWLRCGAAGNVAACLLEQFFLRAFFFHGQRNARGRKMVQLELRVRVPVLLGLLQCQQQLILLTPHFLLPARHALVAQYQARMQEGEDAQVSTWTVEHQRHAGADQIRVAQLWRAIGGVVV